MTKAVRIPVTRALIKKGLDIPLDGLDTNIAIHYGGHGAEHGSLPAGAHFPGTNITGRNEVRELRALIPTVVAPVLRDLQWRILAVEP